MTVIDFSTKLEDVDACLQCECPLMEQQETKECTRCEKIFHKECYERQLIPTGDQCESCFLATNKCSYSQGTASRIVQCKVPFCFAQLQEKYTEQCRNHACDKCKEPIEQAKVTKCLRCSKTFHFDYMNLYRQVHQL